MIHDIYDYYKLYLYNYIYILTHYYSAILLHHTKYLKIFRQENPYDNDASAYLYSL